MSESEQATATSEVTRHAARSAKYVIGGRVLVVIFNFLTFTYVIQKLTVGQYGTYSMIGQILIIATLTTSMGIGVALQRFIMEFRARRQGHEMRLVCLYAMMLRFCAVAVFAGGLYLLRWPLVAVLHTDPVFMQLLPVACGVILVAVESEAAQAILMGIVEQRSLMILQSLQSAVRFVLFVGSLHMGYGVVGIVWAWFILESAFLAVWLLRLYIVLARLKTASTHEKIGFKRVARFAFFSWISQLIEAAQGSPKDIFIMSHFIGAAAGAAMAAAAVGFYAFAFNIGQYLIELLPTVTLTQLILPFFVHKYADGAGKEFLSKALNLYIKFSLFAGLPCLMGFMAVNDKVIQYIFKRDYAVVSPVLTVILAFLVAATLLYPLIAMLRILEKPNLIFLGQILAYCVYNIGMDIILIPRFGILGAALATGSADVLMLIYLLYILSRHIRLSFDLINGLKIAFNVGVMVLLVVLARPLITGLVSLLAVIIVAACVYGLLSCLNRGFTQEERDTINRHLARKVFVF